jgi:tetratricopeptide (TPR) repeat protein
MNMNSLKVVLIIFKYNFNPGAICLIPLHLHCSSKISIFHKLNRKTSKSILYFTEALVVSQIPKCSMSYASQGNLSNLLDSLKKTQRSLGEHHQTCAELHSNIAFVLSKYGNHQEALMNYQKCLKISQKNYGDYHPAIGSCLNYIGNIMLYLGKTEDAISYYTNAIKIYERTQSTNEQVSIFSSLAYIYREMQDEQDAINYSRRAMEAAKIAYKKKPAMLSLIVSNFAETLERFAKNKEALKYYKLAAEVFPVNQNGTGNSLIILFKKIGELQYKLNQLPEALDTFNEAKRVISNLTDLKDLPKDYIHRINHSIGTIQLRLGHTKDGTNSFEIARQGLESLGLVSPLLVEIYYQLARTYKDQGKLELAREMIDKGNKMSKSLPNQGKEFVNRFSALKTTLEKDHSSF